MPIPATPHVIVFSDVDGVLLHPSAVSVARAAAALERLADESVSVVLCSLKTRAELELLQQQLGLRQPFIAESGAAVFVPRGYFPNWPPTPAKSIAGYDVIEFGRPYGEVVRKLGQAAARVGVPIAALSEMSVEEVARGCALTALEARLMKLRDYVELFTYRDAAQPSREALARGLESMRLAVTCWGSFDAVGAATNPGSAVGALRALYGRHRERVITIGMADAFASPGHLDAMDAKVIVHDDPGVSGAIDAGDWAEAIVESVQDIRLRAGIGGRQPRTYWSVGAGSSRPHRSA
jgi:mannosyl-3-phosphoglycerate phosphatase family protein